MSDFDLTVLVHLPLVLPLVLAVVFGMARMQNTVMWKILVAESVVSLVCYGLLVLISALSLSEINLDSIMPVTFIWSDLWAIEFSLKIRPLNSIFLASSALVFCMTCLIGRTGFEERPGRIYAILFLKACVFGAYSTDSFFQFCFFSAASAIPGAFLFGLDDDENTKSVATRFLSVRWVSSFLLMVSFLGLHSANVGWIDQSLFSSTLSEFGLDARLSITLLMTVAFLLQMPLFPTGSYLLGAKDASRFELYLPLLTIANFGVFGACQFLLPQLRQEFLQFQPYLVSLGVVSVLVSLFSMLSNCSFREKSIRTVQFFSAVIVLGLACVSSIGLIGVLILEFSIFIVAIALFGLVSVCERLDRDCSLELLRDNRPLALLFVISVLMAFGTPITYSFSGIFFVFRGLGEVLNYYLFFLVVAVAPMLVVGIYRMLYLKTAASGRLPKGKAELQLREVFFCLPMIVLIVLFSVYPDSITVLIGNAVSEILGSVSGVAGV